MRKIKVVIHIKINLNAKIHHKLLFLFLVSITRLKNAFLSITFGILLTIFKFLEKRIICYAHFIFLKKIQIKLGT